MRLCPAQWLIQWSTIMNLQSFLLRAFRWRAPALTILHIQSGTFGLHLHTLRLSPSKVIDTMKLQTFCHLPQTGWSEKPDASLDSDNTLVLMFGASELFDAPNVIREVAGAFPRACVLGCSTSGEIFGAKIQDSSLVVAALRFERSTLKMAGAPLVEGESFQAGRTIASQLNDSGLRAVLVFSDGLLINGSELVRGINSVLPESVVVTGGLAGDGDRFKRT
jgi:FIST N domain